MIPVLDGTGTAGKSVLEGSELQTALTAIVTAVNAPSGTQPLPTGAATQTTLAALLTALGTPAQAGGAVTVAGVATAAKQPALGTAGTASTDVITVQGIASATPLNVASYAVTATTSFSRPADSNAYVAGDAIADSTSAPTTGGFTLTSMGRASGGSGVITDLIILSNDTAALAGELWIYDSSVTATNDNAALSVSDVDQAKLVAKVPFNLVGETNNAVAHIQNLSIGYTCVGSANLRFLMKATGGTLTTVSANTYTVRAKGVGSN